MDFLTHKDQFENTMLDYLLRNASSGSLSLIQMVLHWTIVDTISGIGVERWISEVSRCVNLMETDDDDDTETKQTCVKETLDYFGYCIRIEMTSTVELAMWKRRIRCALEDEGPFVNIDRANCLLECGSDVILDNLVKYLWSDEESNVDTGLSAFPLCSCSVSSDDEL